MFEPIEIHSINYGHNLLSLFSRRLMMWSIVKNIVSLTLLKHISMSSEKWGILKGSYPSGLLVFWVWGRANEVLPNFILLFIWVYLTPESEVKNIYLNTILSIIEIQYSKVVSHRISCIWFSPQFPLYLSNICSDLFKVDISCRTLCRILYVWVWSKSEL